MYIYEGIVRREKTQSKIFGPYSLDSSLHLYNLAAIQIEVLSAILNGQSATIEYDTKATTVTFTFAAELEVGKNQVLALEYNGILNGDMAG